MTAKKYKMHKNTYFKKEDLYDEKPKTFWEDLK